MCYVFFYLLVYWLSCTFLVTSFKKSTSNEPIEKKGILIKYIWGADDPPTPPTPPPSVTVVIINILIKIIINSISQSIKKPFIFSSTQIYKNVSKMLKIKRSHDTWRLFTVNVETTNKWAKITNVTRCYGNTSYDVACVLHQFVIPAPIL